MAGRPLLSTVPQQEFTMKRDVSTLYASGSAVYRSLAPSSAQPATGVVGDGGATESAVQEDNERTVGMEQRPVETMNFPGPFAHVPPPAVVHQFVESDGIAPPPASATSAATDTPASATALSAPQMRQQTVLSRR
jgi:hypothetical protein